MKKIVRDDIIDLITFTNAEFKYIEYLELLKKSGNYCFLSQFRNFIPKGRSIVNGMIENNLIGTESINKNYKYIYLTDTAMKFLLLRSSDKDFSIQSKKSISVKKVSKYPSEKQLLSSAYKFHMILNEEEIDKEYSIKNIADRFYKWYIEDSLDNYISKPLIEKIKKEIEDVFIEDFEDRVEKEIHEEKEEIKALEEFAKKIGLASVVNTNNLNERLIKIDSKLKSLNEEIKEKEKNSMLKAINRTSIAYLQENIKELNEIKRNIEEDIETKRECTLKYTEMKRKKEGNIKKLQELKENKKQIDISINEAKEEAEVLIDRLKKKINNLYNISKIIVRIKADTIEFIILDTGSLKTAKSYNKIISSLREELYEIEIDDVEVIIYSYAENRALNLKKEFMEIKKDKLVINTEGFSGYRRKSERDKYKKMFLNKDIFYGDVSINTETYYLGAYKEIDSSKRFIKKKDIKAIEDLAEKLGK